MDTILLHFDTPTAALRAVAARSDDGDARTFQPTASNLATAFLNVATVRSNHAALETNEAVFSFDEVLRAAQRVQQFLRTRPDYSVGMRVVLKLPNSAEYVAAFYGTLLADCVAVPIPVSIERLRWQQIQELCQPQLVFTQREHLAGLESNASTASLQLREATGLSDSPPAPRRHGDDLAMVLFTSGSTGVPKGVSLSHRNLLANAESILHDLPIRADDKALVLVPFCHAFGNSILQTHILAGATMVVGTPFLFPAAIVQALAKFGATSFSAIPDVFGTLLKYGQLGETPLPSLRYMSVAGGGMRHDMAANITALIAPATFHVMYGQTEASPRLASLPPDQLTLRKGSIGKPILGVELAIRDESGRDLPPGEVGMLCARGDNVMLGYWNDPESTAMVLSNDGWLQTGDLAHRDEDGYFYIDGRANLLVKIQGHRVHPAEIEGVVEASFPNTRAVALPMARGEETRFALFVAAQNGQPIDMAEIRATCIRELPTYKVPLHFEIVKELPLTSALKVDRAALSLRIPQY